MADQFENTFESGDLTEWLAPEETNGTAAASSSANRFGTYGGRLTFDGTGAVCCLTDTVSGSTLYTRGYFRFSSGFSISTGGNLGIHGIKENFGDWQVTLALLTDGSGDWDFRIKFAYGTQASAQSSLAITPHTDWMRFEIYTNNGGGTGNDTCRAKIYDNVGEEIWDSGDVVQTSVSKTLVKVGFGGRGGVAPADGDYIDIDQCACDTTGWIGANPDIFSSGLETETDAFTTEFTTKVVNGGNTVLTSAVAADIHSGSKGAKVELDGSSTYAYASKSLSDHTEHYFRGYIRFDSDMEFAASYNTIPVFSALDGSTNVWQITFRSGADPATFHWYIRIRDGGSTVTVFQGEPDTIPLNTWILLEMHWKAGSGSDGGVEFKVNGVSQVSDFTRDASALAVDSFRAGHAGTATVVGLATGLAFDDVGLSSLEWLGEVEGEEAPVPVEITPPLLTTSLAMYNPTVENETIGLWDMGPFIYGAESGGVDVYPPKLASLLTMHNPVVYAVDVPTAITPNLVTSQLTMLSPTVTVKDILKLTIDINGKPIVYDGPVAIITGANSDVTTGDDLCIRVYGSAVELFVNGVRIGDPYLFLGLKDSATLTLKALGTGGAVDSIETFPGDPPVPSDVG